MTDADLVEERPYRSLVERMSEGAALVAADGLIVYANGRLASLLGVPLERLPGGLFSDWLDEPERAAFIAQLAAGGSGHGEHTVRLLDGTGVPVLVGLNATEEPSGSLRALIVTDLSQQKAQQEQQHQVHRLNAKLTDQLAELQRINSDFEEAERLLTDARHRRSLEDAQVPGRRTVVAPRDLDDPGAMLGALDGRPSADSP